MLADRYRVVGLLGRGGMGEVYRADDLKLARPVALKFLPEAMERDPGRLARFLNEVRTALAVTHPNVCRVHDIGETGGRHFLSMEYVDGEDLSTLLRRVGHLPEDRAIRVARQLCAGLAAAHGQGVLHRDLKPANVMIDGRGEVKIADFGLAGAADQFEGREIRVGTPAYMAPEQRAGREVTRRSDIYALGLVLYELFSGRAAFPGHTAEEIARREDAQPPSLTSLIDGLNPAVARIVDRCLAPNPEDRPGSAMAVSAALPGGDPLAAALAAGETPSPELIAEAGASSGLSTRAALLALLTIMVAGVFALTVTSTRTLVGHAGLTLSNDVLIDRASQVLELAGYEDEATHRNHTWVANWSWYSQIRRSGLSGERWRQLREPRPAAMLFVLRTSRFPLLRTNKAAVGNWIGDPPAFGAGMIDIWLTPDGRLDGYARTPDYNEVNDRDEGAPGATVDWTPWFEAAGLDPSAFEPVEPELRPRSFADRRYAWSGREAHRPDAELRVEAASQRGHPMLFTLVDPWERPVAQGEPEPVPFIDRVDDWIEDALFLFALIGAGFVAVRNVRLGRGDHRTALRFGIYLALVRLVWLVAADHQGWMDEINLLRAHLAWSAYRLAISYVFYLALEPYARRLWPGMLVSWVRLFSGRLMDPRVGRDVLIGLGAGAAIALVQGLTETLPEWLGLPGYGLRGDFWSYESLRGVRSAVVGIFGMHATAVLNAMIAFLVFLVTHLLVRRLAISVVIVTLLTSIMFNPGSGNLGPYLLGYAINITIFWILLLRAGGLLPMMLAFTVNAWLTEIRVTSEFGAWHALPMWCVVVAMAALAIWGFRAATSGPVSLRGELHGT